MSFLINLVELVLMVVVALDTLGFIYQNRKNPAESNPKDFSRLCFTWIFFLALRALVCCACGGFFGSIIGLVTLLAKVYISIPMLGGADNLYTMLIEKNVGKHYAELLVNTIKQKCGGCCMTQEKERTD